MANTFDSIPDPAAANGAFPGSAVGPQLYGVSPLLSSVVIEIGKKPGPATPAKIPSAGYATPMVPGGPAGPAVPDLVSLDKAAQHIYSADPGELSTLQKQMWDG